MIETDIDYPTGLPNPLREGHALNPVQPFVRTGMASGRAVQRRQFTSVPTLGTFDFLFKTDVQAAAFEAWFRDAIHDGADWFNIERKTPLGLNRLVCRFTSMYSGPTLVGRSSWRYSCPLEVWERPLMPPGWGEFPWFVTGASIFDLAMNREWPKDAAGAPEVELLSEEGAFLLMEGSEAGSTQAVKISQLPLAQPLTGNEYIPVIQSGVTKKSKASDISKSDDTNYAFYYGISKD